MAWTDLTGVRQQKLLPGLFGSEESKAAYSRIVLEVATSAVAAAPMKESVLSVAELMMRDLALQWTITSMPRGDPRKRFPA